MRHARADYDRIQDPANKIADNEPVFLIRAQDRTAALAVEAWAALNEAAGTDPGIVEMARQHAVLIRVWQDENGTKLAGRFWTFQAEATHWMPLPPPPSAGDR